MDLTFSFPVFSLFLNFVFLLLSVYFFLSILLLFPIFLLPHSLLANSKLLIFIKVCLSLIFVFSYFCGLPSDAASASSDEPSVQRIIRCWSPFRPAKFSHSYRRRKPRRRPLGRCRRFTQC